jgi:hypothetical protein
MKKLLLLLACAALMHMPAARAEVGTRFTPCGYQQFASGALASAQPLTVPGTCTGANGGAPTSIVVVAETQSVRYRDDGVAPTAAIGMPIAPNATTPMVYTGTISQLQFIQVTAGAVLNVLFYR